VRNLKVVRGGENSAAICANRTEGRKVGCERNYMLERQLLRCVTRSEQYKQETIDLKVYTEV
jgi:hypothetical protein